MSENIKYGMKNASILVQSNNDEPMFFIENNDTGEQVALVWTEEQAIELLEKLGEPYVYTPTNKMTIYTLNLLLLSTIRKLTETLVQEHIDLELEDQVYGRIPEPKALGRDYK
jgi:hypothetical protein